MQADTLRGGPRSPWRARCPGWSSVGTSEDPVTVRTCAHRRSKCLSQEPFTAAHLSAKFPCLLDSEPALDVCLLGEERAPVRTQSDLGQVPALFRPVSPNRHCLKRLRGQALFVSPALWSPASTMQTPRSALGGGPPLASYSGGDRRNTSNPCTVKSRATPGTSGVCDLLSVQRRRVGKTFTWIWRSRCWKACGSVQ